MLTSIALAGEGSLGSQVIVCTDGASNKGLGSVSNLFGENVNKDESAQFYS